MHFDDTIVALSSSAGPGERAIIRISGPQTRPVVASVFGEFEIHKGHLIHGELRLSGVHSPLPATLYFFQSPHSYTGQDLAELHTIGSPPLVERLIADLLAAGARAAGPGEFTQRAFLAGKLDLTRAEAVQAVIEAGSDDDLKIALAQLAGNLARPLDALRNDLLNLLADVEAALDFVDEDIEFVSRKATLDRLAAALAQLTNLRRQLDDRTLSGRPMRVALAGKPNAGKSSLFNALVGSAKAIVSPIAGTTRDYLTATISLDGLPVELIDTAGLHDASDSIERQAQHLGRGQAERADLVIWCAETGQPFDDVGFTGDVIRVRTKSDLAVTPSPPNVVSTSAVAPNGTAELRTLLASKAAAFAKSPLAPSASRCRAHVEAAIDSLRRAHGHALNEDPAELLALELRKALDQIGEMVGAVYTNDLMDRIFSRFCIGK
jgi:tRNA modification GTPase